jgi:hypothetical protein
MKSLVFFKADYLDNVKLEKNAHIEVRWVHGFDYHIKTIIWQLSISSDNRLILIKP